MHFRFALIAIAAVLGIHFLGMEYGIYWDYPQFDIVTHTGGGLAMGLVAIAGIKLLIDRITFQRQVPVFVQVLFSLFLVLGFVALVGIAWEWYEFIFDVYASRVSVQFRPLQMGLMDTMGDLFCDLAGGAIAYGVSRFWRS